MSYRDGSLDTLTNRQKSISSGSSSELRGNDLSKTSPAKNSPAFLLGGSDAQCKECGKHVYEMEKTMADQIVYHKSCFRCTQCKKLLNASTFTSYGGVLYCKPHFIELLKPKGQCKDMDDAESEQGLNEEENMKTPALPAVKDMKGLFETPGQAKGSFSSQASNYNYNAKSSSNREKTTIESSLIPINRVVNNDDDDSDEESDVLPPADITRNLVAKFRQLEKGDGSCVPILPKPVRQFTPPRESPERSSLGITREPVNVVGDVVGDVVRFGDPAELEDELPPPCIARNLIAKFGSRVAVAENVSDEDDRPTRPTGHSGPIPDRHTSVRFLEEIEYADGGIFENDPEQIFDVVRETDTLDEADLPETGMARALVEQWKSLQSEVEKSRPQLPSAGSLSVTPITSSRSPATGGKIGMSGANPGSQTVGAGMEAKSEETGYFGMDETSEDDLPPQDITRNLLAKFSTIAVDQQPTLSQTSSKKQFRWDVKEAKPINYPGLVTVSKTPHSGDRPDKDSEDEDEELLEDDGGDHPSYAKIMLQKFRSMEKS